MKSNEMWLHFAAPFRVLSTTNISEVPALLRELEEQVNLHDWHAAGFVSYEAAPAFDIAFRVRHAGDFPLLWFGLYPRPRPIQLPVSEKRSISLDWKPTVERETYYTAVEKIRDYIARGRTYQVNYTMRLRSDFDESEWDFFLRLTQSQNKYAAYIDTGRHVICSASPELFFELDGDIITSQPMKGTVKRGRTTFEDLEQAKWLQNSVKNRAENVMIVDMIRNDIGRIAATGSVHVPELFRIEKYATLFQMTSTVQAQTKASLADILGALFPCGSITGAPKISTMDIISELETTPRKIYTGSIGHISPDRKAQFNVAIRTTLIDRVEKTAEYGVGGGVVWDSTHADEYDEALLKARVLTEPPQGFSIFESLLWTPEEGYFLLEKHIARMSDSAEYFDFAFSERKLKLYLDELVHKSNSSQRVKVLLDRSGELTGEIKDLQLRDGPFKACLAEQPVDSNNLLLFHKTTQRQIYENALKNHRGCQDVLLQNEKRELTEFTIGNLVVELNGEMLTPPVSCGLLAGTFREHLLETGQIKERVIRKEELRKCKKIFLINSVRKWVEVQI